MRMINFLSLTLAVLLLIPAAGFAAEAAAPEKNVRVRLDTTKGPIVLELYPDKAPKSVDNFVQYAKDGFYDGTIFHRVIEGFMIQGGGFDKSMAQKPTRAPIANEADNGLKNEPYSIAMARTADPHSATAQFYINVADNKALNHTGKSGQGWGYAVFGKVLEGKETVDKIKSVITSNKGMHQNVPVEPVVITKAEILK